MSDLCGTVNYLSPEVIKETGKIFASGGYNGQPADIWSAGVILYNMVSGENPFYHQDKAVSINNIINGNVEYPDYFSKYLIDFLTHIFNPQPKNRYTIIDIKNHLWFKENRRANTLSRQGTELNTNNNTDKKALEIVNRYTIVNDWINMPLANCFVLSSMIAGKWIKSIFKIDKGEIREFEARDSYEYYGEISISNYEESINAFFYSIDPTCSYINETPGFVLITLKVNQIEPLSFKLHAFKISNSKLLFSFIFKDVSIVLLII